MFGLSPRFSVISFINTEELACLYLKAAADGDTGSGDTIRLAWRDVKKAHCKGYLATDLPTRSEELSRVFRKHSLGDTTIRKITKALLLYRAIVF